MKIVFLIFGIIWIVVGLILPVTIIIRKINEKRGSIYPFKIQYTNMIYPSFSSFLNAGICLYVVFKL